MKIAQGQRQQPTRRESAIEGTARPEEDTRGCTTGRPLNGGATEPEPILNRPFTVNSELAPDELYQQLAALEPRGLIGFASSLAALAHWMVAEGRELPSVEQTWTTSEVLSLVGAHDVRKAFGTDALNTYASNEFGFMAWQSDVGGPLVFESDRLHVETVTRAGDPAAPGEDARLLVTDLLNDTMPLIRYEIGDVARAHEDVYIGGPRNSVAITDLEGKEADILEPPDGRTRDDIPGVASHQRTHCHTPSTDSSRSRPIPTSCSTCPAPASLPTASTMRGTS